MTYDTMRCQSSSFERALRWAALVVWGALTPFALARLFVPNGVGGGHGAILLWVALLYSWWLALSFLGANWALGAAILRRFKLLDYAAGGGAFHLFALGTGLYLSYAVLLLLAGMGQVNAVTTTIGVLAVWWFAWSSRGTPSAGPGERPSFVLSRRRAVIGVVTGIAALAWASPYLLQTLLPCTDWDGAMYHLPLAKRFLTEGLWSTDPDFEQYNFAGAIHLFYALFMALGADKAVEPFNLLIAAAVVAATYSLAREFWGAKAGALAAVVCSSVNLLWEMGMTPRIDIHLTLLTVLACYAFLLWERRIHDTGLLVIMGMMLGVTMGVKFTAMFSLAVLGVSTAAVLLWRGRGVPGLYRAAVIALCCVAIPSGFWYVRNALELGDPVYPLAHGTVYRTEQGHVEKLSSAVARLNSRMPPSTESESQFNRPPTATVPGTLLNWWNMLTHPSWYARVPYDWLSPFLVVFFVAPLFRRDRTLWWLYGIALALYLVIAAQTYLVRYVLPVLPLFAVGAGVVLARINRRWGMVCLGAALTVNLAVNSVAELQKVKHWHALHWLRDAPDVDEWISYAGYNGATAVPNLIRHVNTQIQAGAGISENDTIFMVGAGTGYHLKCRSLPDCSRIGQRFLAEFARADGDYARVAASLAKQRVRYLLVDEGYIEWVVQNIPLNKRKALPFAMYHLERFTREHAELVWNEAPQLKFYRLKDQLP
ncbi:MAG: glycosyltransferase family 39 protein [Candidatus Hydrogenedentes bacterium]|nr:glycosyltransferase family 39 protein [Candidatus Hydrogenedentota bacterium]